MQISAPIFMFPTLRGQAGAFVQDGLKIDAPWHTHDMHQVQYAFDGFIEVEDAGGRHLLPRQLAAWIPAGVVHRTSLHRVRSGTVLLPPDIVSNAGDRVRIIFVPPLMRAMLVGAMRWPLGEPRDAVSESFFQTFGLLCAEWIEHDAPLNLPSSTDARLQAAMDYTRANLATADMDAASAAANLSARSLRRRFRDLGISWEGYRRRARLLRAIELLDGRLSIGAIAAEIGFESQGAFAKAFREVIGVSPAAFRARSE